jgi:aminopeptidase N
LKPVLHFLIICLPFVFAVEAAAQEVKSPYRGSPAKINDLLHTKLDLHFDYGKQYVYGKAWLTLKPHFYRTDSLRLDAKGMDLKYISVVKNGKNFPLKFTYDSLTVAITLDKSYEPNESYTIYIDYTAKPKEAKVNKDAHGLYFINPEGREKGKPTQIWTTGEAEHNSCWFPTIDKPNQKCTEEISLTVLSKYTTLSNGRLAVRKLNKDGTRTDTWKMDLPHSPYLFMIAVGEFNIVKDSWQGKAVNYYMQPEYVANAKAIFGDTPEAMSFFSRITGVDFPWNKYAQIRVIGFNGGMENTTAAGFQEDGKSSPRELADLPYQSGNIHELFHQWFGDYVTPESWSNLPLSESFADLGEILWAEYKYGQDVADEHVYQGQQSYLTKPDKWKKELIRFHYKNEQDMFDGVSYQKGGRILNMLRHYLGNAAFYKGLHLYLSENAFKNAEATQLRLAMEAASGMDLNWFFDQWFYRAGHPFLDISYHWEESTKTQYVYLKQQQGDLYTLPFKVDLYAAGHKQRYPVWMRHQCDTLKFQVSSKPNLVNVDAEKILLATKTEHKTMAAYAFQYAHAPLFLDRCEAIDSAATHSTEPAAQELLVSAVEDKYYSLRIKAMQGLTMTDPILTGLAEHDPNNLVRAEALNQLGKRKLKDNLPLYQRVLQSSTSFVVQGAALNAVSLLDSMQALKLAKTYAKDSKGKLRDAIIQIYCKYGGVSEWPYVYQAFAAPASPLQYTFTGGLATFAGRVSDPADAQQGIAAIAELVVDLNKFDASAVFIATLQRIRDRRLKLNDQASADAADMAIRRIKAGQ